jgi:hypothetical protein
MTQSYPPPPVVAIFNGMDELLDMLRISFEDQGFTR